MKFESTVIRQRLTHFVCAQFEQLKTWKMCQSLACQFLTDFSDIFWSKNWYFQISRAEYTWILYHNFDDFDQKLRILTKNREFWPKIGDFDQKLEILTRLYQNFLNFENFANFHKNVSIFGVSIFGERLYYWTISFELR